MDTSSEEWRNYCEAKDLLTWSLAARRKQLALVYEKRGQAGYDKLTQEILRQWNMTRTKQLSTSIENQPTTQQQKQIELI